MSTCTVLTSDIDEIVLDREFRFYHSDAILIDKCFKSKKRLYDCTAYTSYRLMKHSDTTGDFFVLCKI